MEAGGTAGGRGLDTILDPIPAGQEQLDLPGATGPYQVWTHSALSQFPSQPGQADVPTSTQPGAVGLIGPDLAGDKRP